MRGELAEVEAWGPPLCGPPVAAATATNFLYLLTKYISEVGRYIYDIHKLWRKVFQTPKNIYCTLKKIAKKLDKS